ncbi:MAG: hypothetical protein OER22_16015 [Gammaproteobacteria bacterium]|nr:hypothetical protein [Gammaproteobacteria bacterium]MDH3374027.1 hypothetical protein [Gammaproteobacteria bacterium]MDH3408185.1 hypothetical protein [Gammaproteobacteria bacterium]MDH3554117.1 hypothetical protein [Gammaproteobacteria bacterium]
MNLVRLLPTVLLGSMLALTPLGASAYDLEDALRDLQEQYQDGAKPGYRVAQNNGGKSLSEAVEQVRRQTKGRVLSAETKVNDNREVHHIKVLTKDGKVKTHKVQGRKRG